MQSHTKTRFASRRATACLQFAALAACLLLAACGGGGASSSSTATGTSSASSAAAGNPVIVSIGANPTSLTVGETAKLTWSSSNATACQASGAWSGTVATSGTQLITPNAAGTYTYTLSCNGVAKSETLVVAAAPTLPTVSMSLTPSTVIAGQSSTLAWSTTNASGCTASGAWAGNKATSGSTSVTQAVAGTYTYNLACIGAGGSASGSVTLGATVGASNVALVFIDNGPAGASNIINVPFASVTVCRPGTSICQTIDHLLVDTGSYGLRIIAPGVLDAALALPAVTGASGNPAGECAQFFSGYMWGAVRRADVKIAGETAASLPVQIVGDSAAAFAGTPTSCSSTGANLGTVAALGANGILGVGLFNHDCGAACVTQALAGAYYECSASGCTAAAMPLASQVSNPVAAFATDNNGVILNMPAVGAGGATTLSGTLTFGIDTQSNNGVDTAKVTVYAVNSSGNFTTTYKGAVLSSSFLDSGSNGLFFTDLTIPRCSISTGFYCPAATLSLSATNTSANGAASGPVSFTVENMQALDPSIRAASVGGSIGRGTRSRAFDWGMPFFYGRTVFVAIDGAATQHGSGPYWAY